MGTCLLLLKRLLVTGLLHGDRIDWLKRQERCLRMGGDAQKEKRKKREKRAREGFRIGEVCGGRGREWLRRIPGNALGERDHEVAVLGEGVMVLKVVHADDPYQAVALGEEALAPGEQLLDDLHLGLLGVGHQQRPVLGDLAVVEVQVHARDPHHLGVIPVELPQLGLQLHHLLVLLRQVPVHPRQHLLRPARVPVDRRQAHPRRLPLLPLLGPLLGPLGLGLVDWMHRLKRYQEREREKQRSKWSYENKEEEKKKRRKKKRKEKSAFFER